MDINIQLVRAQSYGVTSSHIPVFFLDFQIMPLRNHLHVKRFSETEGLLFTSSFELVNMLRLLNYQVLKVWVRDELWYARGTRDAS